MIEDTQNTEILESENGQAEVADVELQSAGVNADAAAEASSEDQTDDFNPVVGNEPPSGEGDGAEQPDTPVGSVGMRVAPESESTTDEVEYQSLPEYVSRKKVNATKLAGVQFNAKTAGALLIPDNPLIKPFTVSKEYVAKHNPTAGGYYVLYQDGYESFSPAEAFESGYTKVE